MATRQSLRIDSTTIKCILDSLDAQESQSARSRESRSPTYPYRVPALRIELQEAGGSLGRYVVPSRCIGRDGISFLMGKLIYPDTPCKIDLVTAHNHWQSVTGSVVGCRYLAGTGSVYETDVRFLRPIDIALFIAQGVRVSILVVDASPARNLLCEMLRGLNTDIVICDSSAQAIEKAFSQHYDLILMDMEMPVVDGFQIVQELRAKNYTQTIVAVTSMTSPADRARCFAVGCDEYLTKPPNPQAVTELVNRMRPEPLASSLAADHPELAGLIDQFVLKLPDRALGIQRAFRQADLTTVGQEAQALKNEALAYGFEPIGAAAADLENAVLDTLPVEVTHTKVGTLVRLCCAARPATTAASLG